MKLVKLTEDQIKALPISDKEQKSNEAFAKLASIINHYNDGWQPSKGDLGYLVYSRKLLLLWGGNTAHYGTYRGLGYAYSNNAFSHSSAYFGARLAIRDYDLCKFMIKNYKQEYKDLWMEE